MLLLQNGLLIHGDPAVAPRLADVLLDGAQIAAVGRPGEFAALSGPVQVVDLGGRALLPGLIDCHVHLCLAGDARPNRTFAEDGPERLVARAVGNAQRHLAAGVTTVRDLGGPEPVVFAVRDAIRAGLVEGPRVLAAGHVVTRTGGHGHWMGALADDAAGVERAVRGRIAAGADCIKIIATGGVHTPGSDLMQPQYSLAELRAGVAVAHAAGRKVGSHASNPAGIANAVRAGVDSVEHGVFLDDATAELIARHGTTFVPTLAATHLFGPNADHPDIPDDVRAKAALTVPAHRASFPRAVRAGVRLAVGTDAGSSFVLHGLAAVEVRLLTEYGVPPPVALAGATKHAAELLGLDREIGTVEVGKQADLVVVDGDPLKRIADLERVALVVQGGRIVRSRLGLPDSELRAGNERPKP